MTRDDIIRMAEEAGFKIRNGHIYPMFVGSIAKPLHRFANSIVDHVREEDAMICIDYEADIYNADVVYEHIDACAERIRAMKGEGK